MAQIELLDGRRARSRARSGTPWWATSRPSSSGTGSRRSSRPGRWAAAPAGSRGRWSCARPDGLVAACPLYVKQHSEGEFVFDWGWADAAPRAGIAYYPKLLVGVPFTPVAGARFLVARGPGPGARGARARRRAARALPRERPLGRARELLPRATRSRRSSRPATCCGSASSTTGATPATATSRTTSARFRSKRRNQIRRERRALAEQGVEIEVLRRATRSATTLFEPMYRFYRSTVEQHAWGRQYLNRAFFELLRRALPPPAVLRGGAARRAS